MAEPVKDQDRWDHFLGFLDRLATWPKRGRTSRRFVVLVASLVLIVALVLVVSDNVWRDTIPRSTIAATAIALSVLVALWLFGTRGSNVALSILAALGAVLIAAGAAINWDDLLRSGPAPPGAVVDCPSLPDGSRFTGIVAPTELGYAHLRAEADLHSDVEWRYLPGCKLAFDGYCLGEPKDDWRFDTQDPVWLRTVDHGGYVASADLQADRIGPHVRKVACPGGEPAPSRPEITAPLGDSIEGPVDFAAAAPEAIQVGFAIYYDDLPGPREHASWHQVAVDPDPGDGINAHWDSRSVPGQSLHQAASVTLMVVPCNGLEFPSELHAERSYLVANRRLSHARAHERPHDPVHGDLAAREVACNNADR